MYVLRPTAELASLEEGEFFYHQLLGMKVVTVSGEEVGEIVEIYELAPTDLLAVRGGGKIRHVPFMKSVVVEVDVEGRKMFIDPPEGLLEL